MPTTEFYRELDTQVRKLLPSGVVERLRRRAAQAAGGRLSRPKAWAPGLLERAGLEGLGRHHLAGLDEKALWDLHGRIHELDQKAPKDMHPSLELAHARVAEALGSRHTLVHDLDFAGRSPHDLEDLTQASYCGAPPFGRGAMSDECLHEAHAHIHLAWTIKAKAYPKKAPPLHQPLPHAAWLAHGHAKGVVSGAAGAEGWHAVVSVDPRGNKHKVYGLVKLAPSRPMSWAEFRVARGDHKISKRTAQARWPKLSGYHYRHVLEALPLVEPRVYVKHRGEVDLGTLPGGGAGFTEPFGPLQDHQMPSLLRAHKQVFEAMKARGRAPEGDFLSEIHDAGPGDGFPAPYSPSPEENTDVAGRPVGADFVTPSRGGRTSYAPVEHPLSDRPARGGGVAPAVEHDGKPEPGSPPFQRRKAADLERALARNPKGQIGPRRIPGGDGPPGLGDGPSIGGGMSLRRRRDPSGRHSQWQVPQDVYPGKMRKASLEETPGMFSYRLKDPDGYKRIRIVHGSGKAAGMQLLVGFRPGADAGSEVISLHFPKPRWDEGKVRAWLKSHLDSFRKMNVAQVHVNKPIGAFRYVLPRRPAGVPFSPANLAKDDQSDPALKPFWPHKPEYVIEMHGWDPAKVKQHPRALHIIRQDKLPRLTAAKWAKEAHNTEGKVLWRIPHSEEAQFAEFRNLYHEGRDSKGYHVFTNYDPKKEQSQTGPIRKFAAILWKAEDKQHVYGVVMEPWAVDTQGDFQDPAVIEQAAHQWLAHYRIIGEQHGKVARQAEVIESYITPQDLHLGGQTVPKGSWVLGVHIIDSSLWNDIRAGKYTGFSIGGYGTSRPAKQTDMMRLERAR